MPRKCSQTQSKWMLFTSKSDHRTQTENNLQTRQCFAIFCCAVLVSLVYCEGQRSYKQQTSASLLLYCPLLLSVQGFKSRDKHIQYRDLQRAFKKHRAYKDTNGDNHLQMIRLPSQNSLCSSQYGHNAVSKKPSEPTSSKLPLTAGSTYRCKLRKLLRVKI